MHQVRAVLRVPSFSLAWNSSGATMPVAACVHQGVGFSLLGLGRYTS